MKKIIGLAFVALLSFATVTPVFADADDVAWISKCVDDNKEQGQSTITIQSYCTCMNSKMSSSETRSITEWEKTHKTEEEACAKKAGWVGR